jgi:putative phage-type endonuclease
MRTALLETCEPVCSADDREAWLRARRGGIGASDVPAILGLDRYRGPLQVWMEKLGKDFEDVAGEAADWGLRLEPVVIAAYAERSGRQAERSRILYRSKEHCWSLATPDGWTWEDGSAPWLLQAKTTSAFREADWADGVPPKTYAQVQAEMLCLGSERDTVACLIGGQRLVWADVERDERLISEIIGRCGEFWGYVETETVPPDALGAGAAKALGSLFPKSSDRQVRLANSFEDKAYRLLDLKRQRETLGGEIEAVENEVKAAMGDAAEALLPDGSRFTWKNKTISEHVRKAVTFREFRFWPGKAVSR